VIRVVVKRKKSCIEEKIKKILSNAVTNLLVLILGHPLNQVYVKCECSDLSDYSRVKPVRYFHFFSSLMRSGREEEECLCDVPRDNL
jgi:hypothetical protein